MARYAQTVSAGADNTRHLSLGALALCFPLRAVQSIIDECGRASQRVRDLPAAVTAYYVIGMSLFPAAGYEAVLRWLLSGLQWLGSGALRVSGKSSLSRARQRLGEEPLRLMLERLALPLEKTGAPKGSRWNDLLVVSLDGSTLALQDTAANSAAFGRPGNQNGQAAYPQARFVALAESGTHLIFAAAIGAYRESEIALSGGLIGRELRPGMLCLADRYFAGLPLWKQAAATGAHLLWRAKTGLKLRRLETLPDGSWLARWEPSGERRAAARAAGAVTVRVIEYRLGGSATGEVYRLLTTLLDPVAAPAHELAALYAQRWEIELTIKEGKSVLRRGQFTLRSKTPELVRQEFWGLLLAHYLVRRMMAQAAWERRQDPDKLSFTAAVEIIKTHLAGPVLSLSP